MTNKEIEEQYHYHAPVCPYCKHNFEPSDFHKECYKEKLQCDVCEKECLLTIEITWTYETTPIKNDPQ